MVKNISKEAYQLNLKKNDVYICHHCKTIECGKNGVYSRTPEIASKISKKLWEKAEFRDKITKKNSKTWSDPQRKLAAKKLAVDAWNDPKYSEQISKAIIAKFKTQEYRERVSAGLKARYAVDPTYRIRISKAQREFLADPHNKMLQAARSESQWANPEYREKMKVIYDNPEYKERMRIIGRNLWLDIEYRMKQGGRPSRLQKIVYSLLEDLGIKYYDDSAVQSMISYYTVDCRIDKQDNISMNKSLLIEVNGDWVHSQPQNITRDKAKKTHITKYHQEFDLKYIYEHELIAKGKLFSAMQQWLGIEVKLVDFNFNEIIYKLINVEEAEKFITKYHYSMKLGRSGIKLGFFHKNRLCGLAVYSVPIRQEVATKQGYKFSEMFELSRFCIHPLYQVKNLASYLISKSIKFIKNNYKNIKCLVSFSDSTYDHVGTIYKASNWRLDGVVPPDYWYVDKEGFVCHKRGLWRKAVELKMTEAQYASKFDYLKVPGGEKYRYIYKL